MHEKKSRAIVHHEIFFKRERERERVRVSKRVDVRANERKKENEMRSGSSVFKKEKINKSEV